MKTVKYNTEVRRVSDSHATKLISRGWSYCPKHEMCKDPERKKRKIGKVS